MKITLANLHEATEQQVFDHVTGHLLAQNRQALIHEGTLDETCAYRTEEGLRCAAGCLITKEEYNELDIALYEGKGWVQVCDNAGIEDHHQEFIVELQNIHDGNTEEYWRELLMEIAQKRNLEWNFPS